MPEPLKKKSNNGIPYTRSRQIETRIEYLELIRADERLRFFAVISKHTPEYQPSEVLVYFMRRAWTQGEKSEFEQIFKHLFRRIADSLKASIQDRQMDRAQKIREEIIGRFAELIAGDCAHQSAKLDYFEVRFDSAFSAFKISALRQVGPSTIETEPLESFEDSDFEISPEVESAAAQCLNDRKSKLDDPIFRSLLFSAIDNLPSDQKQVIGLLLKGIPIDSKDPNVMTVARLLGCTERTVRNRRDRAFKVLNEVLHEEWVQ